MTLLTSKLRSQLPELYSTQRLGMKPLALVKCFTPDYFWVWYASGFDGQSTFYGLMIDHKPNHSALGYFSLSELKATCSPMGLPVERDIHFEPETFESLYAKHSQMRAV